ncbi:hypothetical protein ES703_61566 [subsurface metagenome]
MLLTITLRKEVPDSESGKYLYNLVKERLNDHPEVEVKGHVTNHYDEEE